MQNNGEQTELSQKYCGNLAYNVILLHKGDDVRCLSSHLCHSDTGTSCDHRERTAPETTGMPRSHK